MGKDSFIIDRKGAYFRSTDIPVPPDVVRHVRGIEKSPNAKNNDIVLYQDDGTTYAHLKRRFDQRLFSILNSNGPAPKIKVTGEMEVQVRNLVPRQYSSDQNALVRSDEFKDLVTGFDQYLSDHMDTPSSSVHDSLVMTATRLALAQLNNGGRIVLKDLNSFLNLYIEFNVHRLVPGREDVVCAQLQKQYLDVLKAQVGNEVELDILSSEKPSLTFNNAQFMKAGLGTERSLSVVRTAFGNMVKRCVREMMPAFIQGLTLELQPKGASETVLVQFGVGPQEDSKPALAPIPDVEVTVPVTINTGKGVPFDGAQNYTLLAVSHRTEMC